MRSMMLYVHKRKPVLPASALVQWITRIAVETDSSILVSALHSHAYDHSPGWSIFLDLKLLILLELVEVVVSFAP
uniref:Uncharacterized protein n=1 Tax=Leersia perrieri TaxID=77586 RepID=A0A0D9WFL4_9ORYZ